MALEDLRIFFYMRISNIGATLCPMSVGLFPHCGLRNEWLIYTKTDYSSANNVSSYEIKYLTPSHAIAFECDCFRNRVFILFYLF